VAADEWEISVGADQALVLLGTSGAISAAASVEFTTAGWFDGTYKKLVFELVDLLPATDNVNFYMTGSIDGGSTYLAGTNYAWVQKGRDTASANHNSQNASDAQIRVTPSGVGSTANESLTGQVSLFNVDSASYKKAIIQDCFNESAGAFVSSEGAGWIKTTSAVDAIKFTFSSGNIASGEILVYGVK